MPYRIQLGKITSVYSCRYCPLRSSRQDHPHTKAMLEAFATSGFDVLVGSESFLLANMRHGGVGCISVTANVAPRLCAELQTATLKGDYAAALKLQDKLMPLHHALFVEASPGPVKYAASLLGLCEPDARLPLVPVVETTRKAVREALVHAGLLN